MVKGVWKEHFEQHFGFWRIFVEDLVNAHFDCGRFESGFARIRYTGCRGEMWIVNVILEDGIITRILWSLAKKGIKPERRPPEPSCSQLLETV